jgi:iron-sulfur cluster assembly protein
MSGIAKTAQKAPASGECPIRLTPGALDEIRRLLEEEHPDGIPENRGLRIGVKGGGCSGLSYLLGFDEWNDQDQVFAQEGVQIIMEPGHAMYLAGMEIDWSDGLGNRGFTFNNPNANETCGCGTSFSA